MKDLKNYAFFAGAALAFLGLAPQALAETALVLETRGNAGCAQLFSSDPGIIELTVPQAPGQPVDGISSDGTAAVSITIVRGTRTEPTTVNWNSVPPVEGASRKRIRAVLVQLGNGNTKAYMYPTGALLDFGLTTIASNSPVVTGVRFCYGGTAPTLAALAPCPLVDVEGGPTPLTNACAALAPAVYFQFIFPRGSDLGPVDGLGPALCVCPSTAARTITSRTCNISDRFAVNACFPEGTPRPAFATNVDEFVRAAGSICAIQCTAIDGLRFCTEFCLPDLP